MWNCDFISCGRPAVRQTGGCTLCDRHLCASHMKPQYHKCPSWKDTDQYLPAAGKAERDEMNKLLLKINAPALLSQASQLRGGVTCSIPRSLKYDPETRDKVMGGMNYHLEIQFGDGVIWIVRIRRSNAASPAPELQSYILQSEVATLQFLNNINIPTPQVYHYETDENNPVGVPYILMEKMPGTNIGSSLSMTWSPENRRKVLSQLADIYIQLLKHPVDKMGSFDHPGLQHVGPFAVESLTDRRGKEIRKTGPCSSIQEYYKSGINLTLDLILRQEIYTSRPVDAYLIHRYLLDTVARVFSFNDLDDGNFYLRHADDKGDHILVDEDFNITGIIDWEWAYTAPKSIAFNSPIALLPVREFYDGINRLGDDELIFAQLMEEKGHPDLGEITRTGRLLHRFDFCCGYDISDWDGFLGLFFGLVNGLSEDLTRKFGDDQHHNWEIWKTEAMEKYWRDERLQKLIQATNFF